MFLGLFIFLLGLVVLGEDLRLKLGNVVCSLLVVFGKNLRISACCCFGNIGKII